jgi:hypothetical protein
MAKFKQAKHPLAFLGLRGVNKWFTRWGNGHKVRCGFCQADPPSHLKYTSQKWKWLSGHQAVYHHGDQMPADKIGSLHGVQRSQERMRPSIH